MSSNEDDESDQSRRLTAKRILLLPAGDGLDRLIAILLFKQSVLDCSISVGGFHTSEAIHAESLLGGRTICTAPLPAFSASWSALMPVLEYALATYGGLETAFDGAKWVCNINTRGASGAWFRIATVGGQSSVSQAVCKAALLARMNPQIWPLSVLRTVVTDPEVDGKAPTKPRRRRPRGK